ncbi:MAG: trypsin-like peptidase domain-containing protein [Pirellulales bacterium]
MLRSGSWGLIAIGLLAIGGYGGSYIQLHWLGDARAQFGSEDLSAEERSRQFEDLERDVAALESQGALLKRVVKLVSPSVVHIEAEKQEKTAGSGRVRKIEEAGSGVIHHYRGKDYILTNRHVIRDTKLENISINLADGRSLQPEQVWMDADTDVAVMAVNAPGLVPSRIGDSDIVDIGDFVLAVGSPFGLSRSVTYGIISAKGRRDLKLGDDGVRFQDFMQTDAAINPGNSGGPLMNLRGEVIGINTAIASSSGGNEGIGFSIPINMTMIIARQLIERGSVARAYLGVSLDRKFTPEMAREAGLPRLQGARITAITPDSPAEAAGLQIGDIVVKFNGVRVENDSHLVNMVSLTEINVEVPVVLFRGGKSVTLPVRVGDRSKFESRSFAVPDDEFDPLGDLGMNDIKAWDVHDLGLTVADLDDGIAQQLQLSKNLAGLLVTEVHPGGPSAGRIDRGEIIDRVGRAPIQQAEQLEDVLAAPDWQRRGLELHVLPGVSHRKTARTVLVRPGMAESRQR